MAYPSTLKNIRMRIETEDPLHYGKKKLKIRGKDLVHLPRAVFKLMDLEVLDLSPEREACLDYKLLTVPSAIGRLVNLTALMLDTNELLVVPVEITFLTNLEKLALSNNHLSELPDGFQRLQKLSSLHLANNKFEIFPQEICEIPSLVFLDLCDNLLQALPSQITKLTKLETLLLFINRLSRLPNSIVKMKQLRCLWLGNNNLKQLPKGFGYLTKLDWKDRYVSSTLDGNPLFNPPLEICRLGAEAIERFQGVGPNIDEEKKALEENEKSGNSRSRTSSDTSKQGVQLAADGDSSGTTTKARSDSTASKASTIVHSTRKELPKVKIPARRTTRRPVK